MALDGFGALQFVPAAPKVLPEIKKKIFLEVFLLLNSPIRAFTQCHLKLDGSLPANPVNDRRTANAVTLKSTFCLS